MSRLATGVTQLAGGLRWVGFSADDGARLVRLVQVRPAKDYVLAKVKPLDAV